MQLQPLRRALVGSLVTGLVHGPWRLDPAFGSVAAVKTTEAAVKVEASLPPWLAGDWRVRSSRLDGVSFPLGRKFIASDLTPGKRMVSILPLPNIGATPSGHTISFAPDREGAVRASRGLNLARGLEAFWPDARVLEMADTQTGRVMIRYDSPTRSRERRAQSIDLRCCSSEGAAESTTDYTLSEVFQQDNIEQGLRTSYMVVSAFSLQAEREVRCRQRVAAFLQPTDGLYFDSLGKSVALYDYSFMLERVEAGVAGGS